MKTRTTRATLLAACLLLAVGCGDDPSDAGTDTGGGTDAGADVGGGVDAGDDTGGGGIGPCNTDCADPAAASADADGDGLPNCAEGADDQDGDGFPACNDPDSDGDEISDAVEGDVDTDGDGVPDRLDTDSDGDGIDDIFEGTADTDEDGTPDRHDLDSDDDGVSDTDEYGRNPGDGGSPVDRDADGAPDFIDLDSDGDGLADAEETGCPGASERALWDTDRDGASDLLEQTFGSDPCDPDSDLTGIVDFFFVLPYEGDAERDLLDFGTDLRRGDIGILLDTTGSMGGALSNLRESLSTVIIPEADERLEDVAFGVATFDDFPCGDFGGGADLPFALLQRMTTNAAAAQAAVDEIPLHNGGDGPESGIEAVYQAATGAGTDDCRIGLVPPFDPLQNYVAGEAEGAIGGFGFRREAVPIVVHITDAPTHANGEGGYPYGATRDEAYEALRDTGVRVIGVANGTGGRSDVERMSVESGAIVPACAWDGLRPAGCGDGQCCTGRDGEGRAPVAGECPLVFDIAASGSGLGDSIVDGIAALIDFAPVDVTTRVRPDPDERGRSGIDTSCFITHVEPDVALPGPGACVTEPVATDFDGDGRNDGFARVTPGAQLFFEVEARNDCVPARPAPQTFIAYIDVVAGGDAVLDTRIVTILVPPEIKQ